LKCPHNRGQEGAYLGAWAYAPKVDAPKPKKTRKHWTVDT